MKNKIIAISFVILLIFFSIFNIIIKDKEISVTERRYLEKLPKMTISTVLDASYMQKLDKYSLDQFILRDEFRTLKAKFNYNIFKKLDNNDIYLKDNHIFKTEYPTNIKSIDNFIKKTNNIINLLNKKNNVYYSIIPDKNYYINDDLFLNIDYELLYNKLQEELEIDDSKYIDLRDVLSLEDYYETDTHWKQEKLVPVVKRIKNKMGIVFVDKEFNEITSEFYGVCYGQSALKRKSETIIYLTNDIIENAKVKYYEDKDLDVVYNFDKLKTFDKYEVFLNGGSSFIEINNPNININKELVIFRDSYASSVTPLLIDSYSKITLIDTRYISSKYFLDLIDFKDQDILFLYSTLIINNSSTLKD